MNAAGAWSPQRTDDGSWTLLHPAHGEACHSRAGAWTQARERYAVLIGELPQECTRRGVVRLLDIGTGLGLNLAAALEACEARALRLEALSLELDPRVLQAAARLADTAGTLSDAHERVLARLADALAGSGDAAVTARTGGAPHRIEIVLGDARTTLPFVESSRRFDAVFLDPFSPRADPPLWEEPFLAEVARRIDAGGRLSTYTTSLRVRKALFRAGLGVGAGPRVGRKAAGTLASRGGSVPALDPRTQRKLQRALGSSTGEK